jgi:hypothetical protein
MTAFPSNHEEAGRTIMLRVATILKLSLPC